jgi:hypothetical protein
VWVYEKSNEMRCKKNTKHWDLRSSIAGYDNIGIERSEIAIRKIEESVYNGYMASRLIWSR